MKTFVMIPTYNEAENIARLIEEIYELKVPGIEIIVVDDDSPDGTSRIVSHLQKNYPGLHLMTRKELKGRGTAGIAGFRYALEHNADYIIEMDADFSHQPKHIPEFLEHIKKYDMVLGSRFVPGGMNIRKGVMRNIVTKLANFYIRYIFKIPIMDCTSGYRCFRRKVLETINIDNTISLGPSLVQELLYKTWLHGFKVKEVPISFIDRYRGLSTFNGRIALQGFIMILILQFLFSNIRTHKPKKIK